MAKKIKGEINRKSVVLEYCYDRLLFALMDVYGFSLNQCKAIAVDFCLKKRALKRGN